MGSAVRRGIADGLCAREDVFVTSKIMPSSFDRASESIDGSLARLDIDYIAIPGSGNPDHIAENIQIFDFALTDDEMAQIAALNGAGRFENW